MGSPSAIRRSCPQLHAALCVAIRWILEAVAELADSVYQQDTTRPRPTNPANPPLLVFVGISSAQQTSEHLPRGVTRDDDDRASQLPEVRAQRGSSDEAGTAHDCAEDHHDRVGNGRRRLAPPLDGADDGYPEDDTDCDERDAAAADEQLRPGHEDEGPS